jgi:hypothetical protein
MLQRPAFHLTIALATLLTAMFFLFCDLGEQPMGPTLDQIDEEKTPPNYDTAITMDSVTKNMRIIADPSKVLASNTDQSKITVFVYNNSHNPIAGQQIAFSTTHGYIQARDTTDTNGMATVTFTAVPINAEAAITATMVINDSTHMVGTHVTLYGLTVDVSPSANNTVVNTTVPVTVEVVDGAGKPVPGARLTMSGATVNADSTPGNGIIATSVTSATERVITVRAAALGAADSDTVHFWTRIPDGQINSVTAVRNLRIFSSRTQLRADNSDFAEITVILTNENSNPAGGEKIVFKTDIGIIDSLATVDSTGRAKATLRSAPVNGICHVQAISMSQKDTVSTQILFSGVALQLVPQATDLKVNELAIIEVYLKDGSGIPIGGDQVAFSAVGGTFTNGTASYLTNLDPNGHTEITVTSTVADTVFVYASALNTSDSAAIVFSNNTLSLTVGRASILAGGTDTTFVDSTLVTATYIDGSSRPITNSLIVFATNAGSIARDSIYTNSSGRASTWLRSGTFSTTATVQAMAAAGSAQTKVKFAAVQAARITLAITPDNVGTNGGVATLIATVTDSNGNMVGNADVNFRILKGPGGGEYITKPVVTTQDGTARSTLIGGSQPSPYRGCEVIVSVGTTLDTTSKLTISGEPYTITVSRPQDDTAIVKKAGILDSSTFQIFIGAIVQDVNGNPVADGTQVHFSAVVSGMAVGVQRFDYWSGLGNTLEEIKANWHYELYDIPFEDINNNSMMDPGIDLELDRDPIHARRGEDVDGTNGFTYDRDKHDYFDDFNGDGKCDEGTVVNRIDTNIIRKRFALYDTMLDMFGTILDIDTVETLLVVDTLYPVQQYTLWVGEPYLRINDGNVDTLIFLDMNGNNTYDARELRVDWNGNGKYDGPESGDFPYTSWESRSWLTHKKNNGTVKGNISEHAIIPRFIENDYSVTIAASAVTKNGIAKAALEYPRQFAKILFVTVNGEANGKRDRDGERFLLPTIVGE